MTVKTRFAPSPTGVLHIGSVRTALFCWLYAKHCNGTFVLRIEDTDRERSTSENIDAILDGMSWLGLDADEGPYYQTDRLQRYVEVSNQLLDSGHAFRCYCSKQELDERRAAQKAAGENTRYDGRCRDRTAPRPDIDPVIRFKNPLHDEVAVEDLVRGHVVFRNEELDDLVIMRSDGIPTYNFAVVVDDSDMGITHVVRGDDHLNNTPRQINILSALGWEIPQYAHLPMILGPDGAKLSKRHGAVDVREYRDNGYLPEALTNYLVRLGWSHGDQEIFSTNEMIQLFDLGDVNASASSFNPEKLLWLNQQHIISRDPEQLGELLGPFLSAVGLSMANGPDTADVAHAYHERAETLMQMAQKSRYCYEDEIEIDAGAAKKHLRPVILEPMKDVMERFSGIENWTREEVSTAIHESAEKQGISLGKLGQPIRVAVSGGAVSPPIDVTLGLVGKARTLQRLNHAIGLIEARARLQ